jgi:tetratricopeptide (TPR) repeat protein
VRKLRKELAMHFRSTKLTDQTRLVLHARRPTGVKPWIAISAIFALCITAGCNVSAQRHNAIGSQALQQGQYSTAINEFQTALNEDPKSANAYYNLGASYYALGKQTKNAQAKQQAEQLYRQAISIDDQHVDAHRGLASVLIETDREQYAFDLLNTWKDRYPDSTAPVVELARLYQEYGDNRRATDLLADALKLDPNNVRTLKAMGHIREIQGQTHLALDNYIRVLQIDPKEAAVAAKVTTLQTQLAQLANPNAPTTNGVANPSRYGASNPYMKR